MSAQSGNGRTALLVVLALGLAAFVIWDLGRQGSETSPTATATPGVEQTAPATESPAPGAAAATPTPAPAAEPEPAPVIIGNGDM